MTYLVWVGFVKYVLSSVLYWNCVRRFLSAVVTSIIADHRFIFLSVCSIYVICSVLSIWFYFWAFFGRNTDGKCSTLDNSLILLQFTADWLNYTFHLRKPRKRNAMRIAPPWCWHLKSHKFDNVILYIFSGGFWTKLNIIYLVVELVDNCNKTSMNMQMYWKYP